MCENNYKYVNHNSRLRKCYSVRELTMDANTDIDDVLARVANRIDILEFV